MSYKFHEFMEDVKHVKLFDIPEKEHDEVKYIRGKILEVFNKADLVGRWDHISTIMRAFIDAYRECNLLSREEVMRDLVEMCVDNDCNVEKMNIVFSNSIKNKIIYPVEEE